MKRSLWALPLCIVGASVVMLSAGAQRGKGPGGGVPSGAPQPNQPAPAPVDEPFTIGKLTFPSKAAWIAGGGYCATPTPSDQVVLAVEAEVAANAPKPRGRNGSGLRKAGFRAAARTVNVYFHVIMDSQGNGDATDAELQAQIDHMNTAFAGQQQRDPAFKISAQSTGDVPYRFRLAGIERVVNDTWYGLGDLFGMQSSLRRGGAADLNVYTLDLLNATGGVLGFATFPFWYQADPLSDGVVMDTEGLAGGTIPGYSEGDLLVHEVGHWVGLYHPFQGSCFRPGDAVADTPSQAYPFWGTPAFGPYPDTCTILAKWLPQTASPGRDPIENFMNYSDDIVLYQFTPGQAVRAEKQMTVYRGL